MKEAIKKSIEGGYKSQVKGTLEIFKDQIQFVSYDKGDKSGFPVMTIYKDEMLLDPQWWICLGKALGWGEKTVVRRAITIGNFAIPEKKMIFDEIDYQMDYIRGWQYQMHLFIDHIADGGTPDEYFKTIIK